MKKTPISDTRFSTYPFICIGRQGSAKGELWQFPGANAL